MEAGSRTMGHVVASESSRAGRQCPEPWDTWQRWSLPGQGGGVWSREARGRAGALPSREAGFGVVGYVAIRPAHCLGLKSLCGGIQSAGYRQLLVRQNNRTCQVKKYLNSSCQLYNQYFKLISNIE
jgi:hypothetical protein